MRDFPARSMRDERNAHHFSKPWTVVTTVACFRTIDTNDKWETAKIFENYFKNYI